MTRNWAGFSIETIAAEYETDHVLNEWLATHVHAEPCRWGWACQDPVFKDVCPYCGGRLIEVTG